MRLSFASFVLGCFALFFAVAPSPATAKTADELKKVEQKLTEQKQQAASIEARETATKKDLSSLQKKLVSATGSLQRKEAEEDRLEDKLDELEKEVGTRNTSLGSAQEKLALLADAFVKINRQPPESFLFRDAGLTEHVHRSILLRSILPKLKEDADHLSHELSSLEDLQERIEKQKNKVAAAREGMQTERGKLDDMVKARQSLLQKTAAEKETVNKQMAELAAQAQNLRQLLEKVSRPPKAPHKGKKKGTSKLRPELQMPLTGKIIRAYGEKDTYGVGSDGILFAGSPGGTIVAPKNGKVVFVGPFKGYGQMVILQHEGGFHSLLAGFGRIDADRGQDVAAGEPLGSLPEKKGGKPELYFEWRDNGDPADPMIQNTP